MESNKKRLQIITNYEDLLRKTIATYNEVYKTDFVIAGFLYDEVTRALVDFSEASAHDVFQMGVNFGVPVSILIKPLLNLRDPVGIS